MGWVIQLNRTLLAISFAVAVANPPRESFAQQDLPADFAIRFEFGTCVTTVLDTFTGVYESRIKGGTDQPVLLPLTVGSDVLTAIHQAVIDARFSEYPSEFRVAPRVGPSGIQEVMTVTPVDSYRLDVRSAGVRHEVSWQDSNRISTPEADRLRALFSKLKEVVRSLPEVKLLRGGTLCG
jgi:hypothetical protein